jgi:hypothetical protein
MRFEIFDDQQRQIVESASVKCDVSSVSHADPPVGQKS